MKTPEQIAAEMVKRAPHRQDPTYGDLYVEMTPEEYAESLVEAINADRAQREVDIIEGIAKVLEDRFRPARADHVRDHGQEFYDEYVAPMIDQIEEDGN